MVSQEEFVAGIIGFAAGIIITAVGTVLAESFREYHNRLKPHIEITDLTTSKTATNSSGLIFFGVSIDQGKTLNGAYVKFNSQRYPWIENGAEKDTVQLLVGEDSRWFHPYSYSFDYVSDISSQQNVSRFLKNKQSNHGILLTVREIKTGTIMFSACFEMPKDLPSFRLNMKRVLSKFSLRLLSEDIKRETKLNGTLYFNQIKVGKLENGVPNLDTVNYSLLLEVTWNPFSSWVFG